MLAAALCHFALRSGPCCTAVARTKTSLRIRYSSVHPLQALSLSLPAQVVKGQMYVAGEIAPWQSRHEYIKHQLLELARVDGQLPDVDIYVASTDFPEYCDITEGPPQCRCAS